MKFVRECEVIAVVQSALLGEVSSRLRAVYVDWNEVSLNMDFYFDGPVQEIDEESVECIVTEAIAMLDENNTVSRRVSRLDFPHLLPMTGKCVYRRREDDMLK